MAPRSLLYSFFQPLKVVQLTLEDDRDQTDFQWRAEQDAVGWVDITGVWHDSKRASSSNINKMTTGKY
ncbi:hypothetical protein Hamer_G010485 [Homarus americanus]|uniref:Uncharacterized protein n=1 Tax=Homarus americanus TaxID=6706 RepID=A0A8J5K3K0_HOMAM|nr:hypothetical protein Hamer_G010485 [Homarus americanus]